MEWFYIVDKEFEFVGKFKYFTDALQVVNILYNFYDVVAYILPASAIAED